MTKVGPFGSPHVHLKKSTSIFENGALVPEKIIFEFFENVQKNCKKYVIASEKLIYRYPDSINCWQ
jgi:hypothetical protein